MYKFYLGEFLLPVTPGKLSVKIKGSNKTITLANDGEVSFLRYPGLTEYSFEALLPMFPLGVTRSEYHRPDYYLSILESYKTSRAPFSFKVLRVSPSGEVLFDTNARVSLEDYDISESAKNGLDLSVSVNLKQYRDFGTKLVTVIGSDVTVSQSRQEDNAPTGGTTYTVKSGDNLWSIAKTHYGNGTYYKKIYEANKDKITNPNRIYAGQELVLP